MKNKIIGIVYLTPVTLLTMFIFGFNPKGWSFVQFLVSIAALILTIGIIFLGIKGLEKLIKK